MNECKIVDGSHIITDSQP